MAGMVHGGLDQYSTTSGTYATGSTSASISTAALAQSFEIIFGIMAPSWASPNNASWPGASTGLSGIEFYGQVSGAFRMTVSYEVVAATTAVTMTSNFTAGAGGPFTGAIIAFKCP